MEICKANINVPVNTGCSLNHQNTEKNVIVVDNTDAMALAKQKWPDAEVVGIDDIKKQMPAIHESIFMTPMPPELAEAKTSVPAPATKPKHHNSKNRDLAKERRKNKLARKQRRRQ